jgi:hypothetical protein
MEDSIKTIVSPHGITSNLLIALNLLLRCLQVHAVATHLRLLEVAMHILLSLKSLRNVHLPAIFSHPWVLQTVQRLLDLPPALTLAANPSQNSRATRRLALPRTSLAFTLTALHSSLHRLMAHHNGCRHTLLSHRLCRRRQLPFLLVPEAMLRLVLLQVQLQPLEAHPLVHKAMVGTIDTR